MQEERLDKDEVLRFVKKHLSEVRPEGLSRAIQREFAKRSHELAGVYQQANPIVVPKPLDPREGMAKAAAYILEQFEKDRNQFPALTLAKYLDREAAKIVVQAWRRGKPIPHEPVARALAELYSVAQRQKGRDAPIVVRGLNRRQRRKLARQEKKEEVSLGSSGR